MSRLFDDIDDETARLIIRLQLQDNEAIPPADVLVSLQLYEEDLRRRALIRRDRRYAEAIDRRQRVARALAPVGQRVDARVHQVPVAEAPAPLIVDITTAEVPVAEVPIAEVPIAEVPIAEVPIAEVPDLKDSIIEVKNAEGSIEEAPNEEQLNDKALKDEVQNKHDTATGVADGETETTDRIQADESHAPKKDSEPEPTQDIAALDPIVDDTPLAPSSACLICMDGLVDQDRATLACRHEYCLDCLAAVFTKSFTDEAYYPARCCTEIIPLETLGTRLTEDMKATFFAKGVEFGTSTTDRVYCSRQDCGTFLTPAMLTPPDKAQCSTCQTTTCTICKGTAHEGECPEDLNSGMLEYAAATEGWKRCPGCQRMVERSSGCNHMTCKCGTQFCYVCTLRYHGFIKACDCPKFSRYDCDHSWWDRIEGRNDCEACEHTMPRFINRCRDCHILACSDCRHHRIYFPAAPSTNLTRESVW